MAPTECPTSICLWGFRSTPPAVCSVCPATASAASYSPSSSSALQMDQALVTACLHAGPLEASVPAAKRQPAKCGPDRLSKGSNASQMACMLCSFDGNATLRTRLHDTISSSKAAQHSMHQSHMMAEQQLSVNEATHVSTRINSPAKGCARLHDGAILCHNVSPLQVDQAARQILLRARLCRGGRCLVIAAVPSLPAWPAPHIRASWANLGGCQRACVLKDLCRCVPHLVCSPENLGLA